MHSQGLEINKGFGFFLLFFFFFLFFLFFPFFFPFCFSILKNVFFFLPPPPPPPPSFHPKELRIAILVETISCYCVKWSRESNTMVTGLILPLWQVNVQQEILGKPSQLGKRVLPSSGSVVCSEIWGIFLHHDVLSVCSHAVSLHCSISTCAPNLGVLWNCDRAALCLQIHT